MKTKLISLITLLAVTSLLLPFANATEPTVSTPFESTGKGPKFYIDFANFIGLENKTYVEFYFLVNHRDLQFYKNKKQFEAGYHLEFAILNEKEEIIERENLSDIFQVETFGQTHSSEKARVSLLAFTLDPGKYILKATVTDLETRKSTVIKEYFYAQSFQSNDLTISDIQLSQKIELAEDGQPYVKNQRYIEPNPVKTFGHGMADIYVYFEVYNLAVCAKPMTESNYMAHFTIHDQDGNPISHIRRRHAKPGLTSAHSIKFPVDHFLTGNYSLTVKILDEDSGQVTETSRNFTVLDLPISMNEMYHATY